MATDDNDRTESWDGFDERPDRPRIERLGHFRIEATLGSGGMGTIYRAYDESMKRPVALKVLHPSLEISERAQSRFVREAWIAGQLDHPNIIKVHSRGEENNVSYLALELAEGGSLYDLIKQTREQVPSGSDVTGTIDQDYINDVLEKFIELAGALEHIHSKGFIHRDIKPHNVLLSGAEQKFKFTDFGIAHADDMTRMTRAGDFIGTVKYMSPELLAAHRAGIDRRTDIYSLGVTLYEALTLTLPFKADSEEKLIGEILAGHYIEARKTNRRVPADLETVLMKACHHDPDLRYQTAAELAEDLQRIIDGRPILARRQSAFSKGIKYVRRNYKAVLGIAAAVIVVVSAILWSFYRTDWAYRPMGDEPAQRQTGAEPTFTKIHVPAFPGYCALSPDGEKLAFMSDDGGLWVAPTHGTVDPMVAGEPVKLAQVEIDFSAGSLPVWSADGKWIAFNARDTVDETLHSWFSMLVIPSDGGELRQVPVKHDGSRSWLSYRIGISPDGQTIAFSADTSLIPGESKTGCIYSIPVAGGQIRRLTDTLCSQPAFSPDGKMLAYVKECAPLTKDEDWHSDIWAVPVDGGVPIQISDMQGAVLGPVWSPDSRMIVFDRFGRAGFEGNELFIVPLTEDYEPAAPPTVLRLPLSSGNLIAGWSSNNQIGITLETAAHTTIYTVPASGVIATQVAPSGAYSGQWSPNGKRIFFCDDTAVFSLPVEGGQASIIPIVGVEWAIGAGVSPDGTRLALVGGGEGRSIGLFTVSVDGGETELVQPTTSDYRGYDKTSWSPDGKWIAFTRYNHHGQADLCVIPSDGGEIRQLVASAYPWRKIFIGRPAWSPDGKLIAYPTPEENGAGTICVIRLEGGNPEIVARFEPGVLAKCVTWSPDGKKLAYASAEADYKLDVGMGSGVNGDIWILRLDTKESVRLRTGMSLKDVDDIDWSLDGEKIVFSAYWASEEDFYLIDNFLPLLQPDRPEPSAEPESKELTVRQVWAGPEVDAMGAPSPDGRHLSYVDWETGNLAVRELAKGKSRHLTTEGTFKRPMQYAMDSRISRDGSLIAYAWWGPDSTVALRLIGIDGSAPRVLYKSEDYEVYPKEWSSNGTQIAALMYKSDANRISWVSVADGSVRILKSLGKEWPRTVCHSPDDRYLAYDHPVARNSGNFDISLLATDGSGEIPLVEHPANDKLLGWASGREEVLFISDRSGTWDAWVVRVVDGRPQGTPRTVKRNIGEISSMAFSQDGSYFYGTIARHFTTYVAPFDLTTGVIQTSLSKPILGSNYSPQWSPDGERLAYVTEHFTKAGPSYIDYRAVTVQHMETGEDQELASEFYTAYPRWSPDGRFIVATGYERSDPQGEDHWKLYKIDVQTEEVTALANHDNTCVRGGGWCLFKGEWSHNGESVFYVNNGCICRRAIETDREERLYRNPDLLRRLNVSPDGQKLIFHVGDRPQRGDSLSYTRRLMMMHVPDGEVTELLEFRELSRIQVLGWIPDGGHLLFKKDEDKGISLWRISSEGGNPQKLWQSEKELKGLSIHPGGQQIAYYTLEEENEIWVMENFLPDELTKR
ncbi:MAG: protein kinase [Candidatus Zixiibacteriota bacterium]